MTSASLLAAFASLLCLQGPAIEVTPVPDKDVPIVYDGEPLILELKSATQRDFEGAVTVSGPVEESAPLGPMTLWAGEARWIILDAFAEARGLYRCALTLDGQTLWEGAIARVSPPRPLRAGPVVVDLPGGTAQHLGLFRHVPIKRFAVRWTQPGAEQTRDRLEAAGYDVMVTEASAAAILRAEAGGEGRAPTRWTVEPAAFATVVANDLDAARSLGIVVRDAGAFAAALDRAQGQRPAYVTVASEAEVTPYALTDEAAKRGLEGIPYVASVGGETVVSKAIVIALASGFESAVVPGEAMVDGRLPAEAFVAVGAIDGQLADARYVGPIAVNDTESGHVFHHSRDGGWSLWLWAEKSQPVEIMIGDAEHLRLEDAFGNALAIGHPNEDRVALQLSRAPRRLSGTGGALMRQASAERVGAGAQDLLQYFESLEKDLLELSSVANTLLNPSDPEANRFAFVGLVHALPALEAAWLDGAAPIEEIGPAIVRVVRLARAAAVHEQETGKPFLEPLYETLVRTRDFLAEYERSGHMPSGRTLWLADESARLIEESERLDEMGRGIEAAAVASLAEWRARALLEHTQERKPAVPPKETAPEEAETEEANKE